MKITLCEFEIHYTTSKTNKASRGKEGSFRQKETSMLDLHGNMRANFSEKE